MLNNKQNLAKQAGQSLIEVLVVLVVATMMMVGLINIILSSLKNAQFAQNQTQATKLAQDTVDKIRILRDGNKNETLYNGLTDYCFKSLWEDSTFSCTGGCYYKFTSLTEEALSKINSGSTKESLGEGFSRQIQVTQNNPEVRLIIQISWNDSSGGHNSNLETILTKPDYACIP